MADLLVKYLREAADRPFEWGVFDCCLFFADWVSWQTGFDPARDLRHTYSTEREMRQLVKLRGGLLALVDNRVSPVCSKTSEPKRGDIGLVRVGLKGWRGRLVTAPTGAIAMGGDLWAIKTAETRHLTIAKFPLVQAWGVHGRSDR